jgi:hypothetical protein
MPTGSGDAGPAGGKAAACKKKMASIYSEKQNTPQQACAGDMSETKPDSREKILVCPIRL